MHSFRKRALTSSAPHYPSLQLLQLLVLREYLLTLSGAPGETAKRTEAEAAHIFEAARPLRYHVRLHFQCLLSGFEAGEIVLFWFCNLSCVFYSLSLSLPCKQWQMQAFRSAIHLRQGINRRKALLGFRLLWPLAEHSSLLVLSWLSPHKPVLYCYENSRLLSELLIHEPRPILELAGPGRVVYFQDE